MEIIGIIAIVIGILSALFGVVYLRFFATEKQVFITNSVNSISIIIKEKSYIKSELQTFDLYDFDTTRKQSGKQNHIFNYSKKTKDKNHYNIHSLNYNAVVCY